MWIVCVIMLVPYLHHICNIIKRVMVCNCVYQFLVIQLPTLIHDKCECFEIFLELLNYYFQEKDTKVCFENIYMCVYTPVA